MIAVNLIQWFRCKTVLGDFCRRPVSILNDKPRAQKDHNGNKIFDMGVAHYAAPMTKISLLLQFFCNHNQSLKIGVCK